MSKWARVRDSFHRSHDDFEFPSGTFYEYQSDSYDSGTDTWSDSRTQIGTAECEFVPPSMDSTVDAGGTDLEFSTSIRIKDTESFISSIELPGDDTEKPSEVEIEGSTYRITGKRPEPDSGFELLRLEEL